MNTTIGYALIQCVKDGAVHSIFEAHDVDSTGFSLTAHNAGWVQTLHSGGRAYCCPACHSEHWKDWDGRDMGR